MKFICTLFLSFSAFAADRDLGENLPFKLNQEGNPAFGMAYTYGNDPDGSNYMLTYTAKTSSPEQLRWNFYLKSKDAFLLEWKEERTVAIAVLSIQIPDGDKKVEQVREILKGQRKIDGKNELYFVLAGKDNTPKFHIPISDLCDAHPGNFFDMTNGAKCGN